MPSGKPKSYSPAPIVLGVVAIIAVILGVMYSTRSTEDEDATSRCAGTTTSDECAQCCAQTDNMYTYSLVSNKCTCVVRR